MAASQFEWPFGSERTYRTACDSFRQSSPTGIIKILLHFTFYIWSTIRWAFNGPHRSDYRVRAQRNKY